MVEVLKRYYSIISIDQALDHLESPEGCVKYPLAITLDDGYSSHIDEGLPVFSKHGVPFSTYVVTGHAINRKPLWFDHLDFALQQVEGKIGKVCVFGERIRLDFSNRSTIARTFSAIRRSLKRCCGSDKDSRAEIDSLAVTLEKSADRKLGEFVEDDHWSSLLSTEDIRRHARNPLVTFGSHTC